MSHSIHIAAEKFAGGIGISPRGRDPVLLFSLACVVAVGCIGLIALGGWVADESMLTAFGKGYIPMAPDTAVAYLILSAVLTAALMRRRAVRAGVGLQGLSVLLVVVVIGYAALVTLGYFLDTDLTFTGVLLPERERIGRIIVGRMSPVTGALLVLSGTAVILEFRSTARSFSSYLPSAIGGAVLVIGFLALLGYIYGSPLLYGGTVIPIAATTALAVLLTGCAIIANAGYGAPLLQPFIGPSVRARMMRSILPITVCAILLYGLIENILDTTTESHDATTTAALSVVVALAAAVVITRVARQISGAMDAFRAAEQRADARWRILFESMEQGALVLDGGCVILRANPAAARIIGMRREAAIGCVLPGETWDLHRDDGVPLPPEAHPALLALRGGVPVLDVLLGLRNRRRGDMRWLLVTATPLQEDGGAERTVLFTFMDVTDRTIAERRVARLTRAYAFLGAINEAIIRTRDRAELFRDTCRIAVDVGGLRIAWIGILHEKRHTIIPVASAGMSPGDLRELEIELEHSTDGDGLIGDAFRNGKCAIVDDIDHDPRVASWRARAQELSYRSIAAVTLRYRGAPSGVMILCAGMPDFFDDEQARLLENLSSDLSYAIDFFGQEERRIEAEAALARSENRYRELVERTGDLVWSLDTDGTCLFVNSAARKILGREPSEIIGRPFSDFIPGDAVQSYTEELARNVGSEHIPADLLHRVVDSRGEEHVLATSMFFRRNDVGMILGVSGMSKDITARVHAEEDLRTTIQRLRTTESVGQIGGWEFDPRTRMFWASPESLRLFGLPPGTGQLTVEALQDVLPGSLNPDDAFPRAMKDGTSVDVEFEFRPKGSDIARIFRSVSERIVDRNGVPVKIAGVVQDITRQKLAERALRESDERLRLAMRSAEHGVYDFDVRTGAVQASPEYAAMLGFDPATFQLTRERWEGSLHPDDREQATTTFAACIRGEQSEYRIEYRHRTADGGWKWILSIGSVIEFEDDGSPKRILGVHTDITPLKESEQRMREMNAVLEQQVHDRTASLEAANRELDAFAAAVSHDLRAPLRGIESWSRILAEECGHRMHAEARTYLERIIGESRRMTALIDDLLRFSRDTRGNPTPDRVDLGMLAARVVRRLRDAHPDRRVRVDIGSDLAANADARLLEIVLTNLMDNAWKFTSRRDDAHIVFDALETRHGRTFRIRDNGDGFDMAFAGRLFAAFQRLHGSAEFPGTGIGLATVQRIIHRHGGRVWADASPGEGATFYFTLPEDR